MARQWLVLLSKRKKRLANLCNQKSRWARLLHSSLNLCRIFILKYLMVGALHYYFKVLYQDQALDQVTLCQAIQFLKVIMYPRKRTTHHLIVLFIGDQQQHQLNLVLHKKQKLYSAGFSAKNKSLCSTSFGWLQTIDRVLEMIQTKICMSLKHAVCLAVATMMIQCQNPLLVLMILFRNLSSNDHLLQLGPIRLLRN